MKKIWIVLLLLALSTLSYGARKQMVIMYIEGGLRQSENYKIEGDISGVSEIKAWNVDSENASLDTILDFEGSSPVNFEEKNSSGEFRYLSEAYNFITFPLDANESESEVKRGNFSLKESKVSNGDTVLNVYIDEDFSLSRKYIKLSEDASYVEGNRFVYSEASTVISENKELYKKQDYMVRISRGNVDNYFDVHNKMNTVSLANDKNGEENIEKFLGGTSSYVDFIFNGDYYSEVQKASTDYGVSVNFVPGQIEIFGLPNGTYTLELYSFRYKNEFSDRDNVIVTMEDSLVFEGSGIYAEEGIELLSFDVSKYPKIEANMITISSGPAIEIAIKEELEGSEYDVENLTIEEKSMDSVYIDGTKKDLDASGKEAESGKYYKKLKIEYNTKISVNKEKIRKAYFTLNSDKNTYAEYKIDFQIPINSEFPYQTVMAIFNSKKDWEAEKYEIKDIVIPKETLAYKDLNIKNASDVDVLRSAYEDAFVLTQSTDDFMWSGLSGSSANALIFRKVKSESKGTLQTASGIEKFSFYTTKGISGLAYSEGYTNVDVAEDKATFTWTSTEKTSYGVSISDDKMIFRISRVEDVNEASYSYKVGEEEKYIQLPKYYYSPATKQNLLKENIGNFVSGIEPYVDLVFDVGEDKEVEGGNAIFSFSRDNSLRISSLPRGKYNIEVYAVQDEDSESKLNDSVDYRVITYNGTLNFCMGLPTIVSGDFSNNNNIFLIENINLTSDYDAVNDKLIRNIRVNFITKAEQSLSLTKGNIVPALYENGETSIDTLKVNEQRDGILGEVSNLELSKSEQRDFQFPLDIIFLIDNSGSMQDEINDVKDGLKNITKELNDRGFNVKCNLITFGSVQHGNALGSWDQKVYKKFDKYPWASLYHAAKYKKEWFKDLSELTDAFDNIVANGGYWKGQENGAWAIDEGINHFISNGRYLNFNNEIVGHDKYENGYISSQKWLILLTDENMDDDNLPRGYSSTDVISQLSKKIKENNIILTGIIHTNTKCSKQEEPLYEKVLKKLEASGEIKSYKVKGQKITITDILGNTSKDPLDVGDKYYTEFLLNEVGNFYSMGNEGINVGSAFASSVSNVGIVQRWMMNYDSSFIEGDGLKRKVIFSLDGINKTGKKEKLNIKPFIRGTGDETDRHYIVPEQKIEAYFINPNSSSKEISKKSGIITLKGKARSEYKDENENKVNYPITRGTFSVSDGKNTILVDSKETIDGRRVDIKEKTIENSKWYELSVDISEKDFEVFANSELLTIKLSAMTKEIGTEVSIGKVRQVEEDLPVLTRIKLVNNTLRVFLESLQAHGLSIGSDEIIKLTETNITDITDFNKFDKLNVKSGDNISVEAYFDEENMGIWDTTEDGVAKNNIFEIGGLSINNPVIDQSAGKISGNIDLNNSSNNTLRVKFTDKFGNSMDEVQLDLLKTVDEIGMKLLEENQEPAADEYLNYYKNGSINVDLGETAAANVLAYLIVFDYDSSQSDGSNTGTYSSVSNIKYMLSRHDNFNFFDGAYNYRAVYPINKAGKISGVNQNSFDGIITTLSSGAFAFDREFYIDTVSPTITAEIFGNGDRNWTGLPQDVINLVQTRDEFNNNSYKKGDALDVKTTLTEYNPYKLELIKGKETSSIDEKVYSEDLKASNMEEVILSIGEEHSGTDKYTIKATDKAGNIKEIELKIKYNDDEPKKVIVKTETHGTNELKVEEDLETYKFINEDAVFVSDSSAEGKNPVYIVVRRNSESYFGGQVGKVKLVNSNLLSSEGKQEFEIYSFYYNGNYIKTNEKVVVDKTINDSRLVKKYTVDEKKYIELGEVGEYVGLSSYSIVNTSKVTMVNGTTTSGISVGNVENPSTAIKYDWNLDRQEIELVNNVPGLHTLKLMVKDKLGNENEVEYIVNVISNIELIGKKEGASQKITTHIEINNISDIEIKNRK